MANIGWRTGISFDVVDLDGEPAVDALEGARAGKGTATRAGGEDRQGLPTGM
jgi:hypothetical protein